MKGPPPEKIFQKEGLFLLFLCISIDKSLKLPVLIEACLFLKSETFRFLFGVWSILSDLKKMSKFWIN